MKAIIGLFFVLLLIIFFSTTYFNGKGVSLFPKSKTVTIDKKTFTVEVEQTEAAREQGLSGRSGLTVNQGMLFLFDHPDRYSFWMKDMKFPIDIIFINNNKVIDIFPNVPIPTAGSTLSTLPIYTPDSPANEVLEVAAGQAKINNFKNGDTVTTSL
ncbi:MAG TPA: DUF192 domain-containing protein [Patescibacteria group bacterium]|nr:DUF192 domain-containing protein [Patescibacteria group bacterium]